MSAKTDNRGVTLVELIIAVTIVVVLVTALNASFKGWLGRYNVESEIRQVYGDMMEARVLAMQRKRVYFAILNNSTSYTFYEDDSDGAGKVPDGDGNLQTGSGVTADTQRPSFPKTVRYGMDWNNAAIGAAINIRFNPRGLVGPATLNLPGTISVYVDRDGDGEKDIDPDYDCIIITESSINLAKLTDVNGTPGNKADDVCVVK
jgi:prepilin-type N-terminal cleavage/methylation domain-containing protein